MNGGPGQHRAVPAGAAAVRRARLTVTVAVSGCCVLLGGFLVYGGKVIVAVVAAGGTLAVAVWSAVGPPRGGRGLSAPLRADEEPRKGRRPGPEHDRPAGPGLPPGAGDVAAAGGGLPAGDGEVLVRHPLPGPDPEPAADPETGRGPGSGAAAGAASAGQERDEPAPEADRGPDCPAARGGAIEAACREERKDGARDGFPILAQPSRAFRADWLLPEQPAPHGLAADRAELGSLVVRAASVVGPGHRTRALARQDAYRIGRDRSGRHLIVAVADGMSDSRHSDTGAQVAVSVLVSTLREALDSGVPPERLDHRKAFLAAARQMHAQAEARGWGADDVRAVAAVAVVPAHSAPGATRPAWVASLGDTSVLLLHAGVWERLAGGGKDGFSPSDVRHFLPHDPAAATGTLTGLPAGSALAVVTDGVGDALAAGAGARDWFARRWATAPDIGAFLMDVGFEQAQMQDDRTAVVVWCEDGEER